MENSHQSWMQNSRNDDSDINSSLQRTNSSNQTCQNLGRARSESDSVSNIEIFKYFYEVKPFQIISYRITL